MYEEIEKEKYLFKVAGRVINWLGIEIVNGESGLGQVSKQELADLVMLDLMNI